MNVRLAAQTLNNSVADAIDFLCQDEGYPNFQGSAATTDFIRKIDILFDLCNSKTPFAKGTKSRIDKYNLHQKIQKFDELCEYLKELTDVSGQSLVSGRRKTPFVGLLVTSISVCAICKNLLQREYSPLTYVLTVRFSQDHLERLFSRIRRKGGWNNNLNVLQLKW
ncbi:THAP domain-containing protein 9 [Plakobranchus ocellatus]|uniref:THAP domain-containing protein 9 n=1 Tax=Plakobranchus ocellatus TaxID=259542 RepID=A0AAV4DES9_9GAST|nr:THAP domain-containing protein 9 [Plakobranchus ocellatus]